MSRWLQYMKTYRLWKTERAVRRAEYLKHQGTRRPLDGPKRAAWGKEAKRLRARYQQAIDKAAEAYRASRPARFADKHDVAALAQLLLDHHNTNCFSFQSDTTNDYAGDALRAWAAGKKYRVRAGNSGHARVSADPDLLRGLLELADHGGRVYGLNCLCTGTHRDGSGHYDSPCRCCDIREELTGHEISLLNAFGVHDFDENEVHDHVYTGSNP
jgi:hypothetical protein